MLDQNTDRMWYVIGAVIVGAALIFLVNSSFPQLFANVGDTFTSKTEDVSKIVMEIKPSSIPEPNLLKNSRYGIPLITNNSVIAPTEYQDRGTYKHIRTTRSDSYVSTYSTIFIDIEEKGDYTTSAYVKSPVEISLGMLKGETDFGARPQNKIPANKWVRVSSTDVYNVGKGRVWGFYSNGAVPEGFQYKEFKFEKGSVATPWIEYQERE